MLKSWLKKAIVSLLGVLTLGINQSSADVIKFTGSEFSTSTPFAFNIKGPTTTSSQALEFDILWNEESWNSFCIELTQSFSWNTPYTDFSLVNPGSSMLPWFTEEKAADFGALLTGYLGEVTSAQKAASMQLAIWAIAYEPDNAVVPYSLNSPSYKATPYTGSGYSQAIAQLAITDANLWLSTLPAFSDYNVYALISPTAQNQLVWAPSPHVSGVPEPETISMLGLGLFSLVWARKKRLS